MDPTGNLYGTTTIGGANQNGTVFKISSGGYTDIYDFCSLANCQDGTSPVGALIRDVNGNLYGTTSGGGLCSPLCGGTAFKLSPPSSGTKWNLQTLYYFCASVSGSNCLDGQTPMSNLSYKPSSSTNYYDGISALYGTTYFGGGVGPYGVGTVFKLTPVSSGLWTQTIMHAFGSVSGDGDLPIGGVTLDASGNIFGTASAGGAGYLPAGAVFKIDTSNSYSVIYNFCTLHYVNLCTDGRAPNENLVLDSSGNIFGVTSEGSTDKTQPQPALGVVFELPSGGSNVTILHSFCSLANCADGAQPPPGSGLILDGSHLYGVTSAGGTGSGASYSTGGTVYHLHGASFGLFNLLHSFCSSGSCGSSPGDGELPLAELYEDGAGNLYGTTSSGGTSNGGTVFKIVP
jgi:uncharacterized repeat protein (TIGR03803 family)